MKWIPLAMIIAGILLGFLAVHLDKTASFESGFFGLIITWLAAGACVVIGAAWLLILVLIHL